MDARLWRCRSSYDLKQCGVYHNGFYQSQWFQGLEKNMEWLRLSLDVTEPFQVQIYVSNELPDESLNLIALEPVMERADKDLILYGIYGKYLCFTIKPAQALRGFSLEFPGHSLDEGLPTVMRGDKTLQALLAVYQSAFMDLNREAKKFPEKLDPTSSEVLFQLPKWLGAERWTQDTDLFYKILPYAHELARIRGTKKAVIQLSDIVTGCPCQVIESWHLQEMGQYNEKEDLYGRNQNDITILVPPQVSSEKVKQFKTLLTDFIPVGLRYQVIHLTDNALADGYSYLDENVVLYSEPTCEMDGPVQDGWVLK